MTVANIATITSSVGYSALDQYFAAVSAFSKAASAADDQAGCSWFRQVQQADAWRITIDKLDAG